MYYPLIFNSVYKEMVWGGVKLREIYSRGTPFSRTGESWDITCRKNEMGIVKNGEFAGMPFISVIKQDPVGIMGEKYKNFDNFPLLIKLIDANDFLSVQVHPDDGYAQKHENYPFGKNEMWYILSAEPNSFLTIGLNDGVTKEMFKKAIADNTVEDCLRKLYVSPHDIINIPAGLIHAIGKGIVLAEIQQNSDITYRVYDYNRVGLDGNKRKLHIEKSLDVIDFSGKLPNKPVELKPVSENAAACIYECVKNSYFTVDIYEIKEEYAEISDKECFSVFTCVKGIMTIEYNGGFLRVPCGDSVFIPAALGEYKLTGPCRALKSSS